jgi:DNA-binding NtrC family response regulator
MNHPMHTKAARSSKDAPHLLLVDDDRHLLDSMGSWLQELEYKVSLADSCQSATHKLKSDQFDLVLADLRLQDGDGFDVLKCSQQHQDRASVILMTGYATVDTGVEAIRAGAFDLLTKPLIDEELEMSIQRALSQRQVIEENLRLKDQLDNRFGLENIVGSDHRMLKTFEVIASVANTRVTILVTGESGTGKSMLARAIHQRSDRRNGPFVEVACGALPENLLESELFGHVAGSFTGATGNKEGKFKQADGGTIFLDEIGTASPGLQVKLLRVLQELAFEPVGGSKTVTVDTRVILATNENLERAVAEGRFRQDLYYRVNVINLELPSLRDRFSDIPELAHTFMLKACKEANKAEKTFSDQAITALQRYTWPGNVRELQNVIERAVLLGSSSEIAIDDLPSGVCASVANFEFSSNQKKMTLKEALEEPERRIILQSLRENNWNRNTTADSLDINRTTLYKKMKRLGLENPVYQQ